MTKKLLTLSYAMGLALLAGTAPLQAGIITFSDIPNPDPEGAIPPGYAPAALPSGVTITSNLLYSREMSDHTGDAANTYVFDDAGSNITFSEPVEVPSLFILLDEWSANPSVVSGYITGNPNPVWTSSTTVFNTWVELTQGAGLPIDTLVFAAQWSRVDDITVNAVPEPASLTLLGVGAVALLARRRKA